MNRCMTCDQLLPEGHEHPEYFARAALKAKAGEADDVDEVWQDLEVVLDYIGVTFHAVFCVAHHDHEAEPLDEFLDKIGTFSAMGEDLAKEALRRAKRLLAAGEIWQERAEALLKGTPAAEQPTPVPTRKKGNGQGS